MENEISWQCPNFEAADEKKLAFVQSAIEQGVRWLTDNCSQNTAQRAMDILSGKSGGSVSSKWSKFTTGDLKRAVLEIVETLADIRPFWGYSTDNKAFLAQSNMMSKTSKAIYLESFVDRSLRDALQFAAVTGMGAISPVYSRSKFGSGDGEFKFIALGQPDILPVQLPRDKNYQNAYIVTLAIPMGVAEAHARFPLYQQYLKPFAKKRYGRTKGGEERKGYDQNRWRIHNLDSQLEQYCDIYYTYVLDLRINYGELDEQGKPILDENGNPLGKEMHMGEWTEIDGKEAPAASWSYTVPYVGQKITRFENGRTITRPAAEDDCRVYPQRRLLISCDSALMYDGPAFDWHGMVPVIPFYLDDWAWEPTGYSLFAGTANTQDAIDDLIRAVYRVAMAAPIPAKPTTSTSPRPGRMARSPRGKLKLSIPSIPDATFGMDGDIKEPVLRPPMPEWCYNVPEWLFKVVELLQVSIQRQLGLDQIQSLQKLKANVSDPEKLLDAEGPIVTGTSRSMERGLRDLGEMMKYLILQYMTTGRIIQYVGLSGIAPEIFDYDPQRWWFLRIFPANKPSMWMEIRSNRTLIFSPAPKPSLKISASSSRRTRSTTSRKTNSASTLLASSGKACHRS